MPLMSWVNVPVQPARDLVMRERSGGSAPPLAARAAWSFGEGRRETVGRHARPVEHLAIIVGSVLDREGRGQRLDLSSLKPGPPGSARLRKETSCIEWQVAQTSL